MTKRPSARPPEIPGFAYVQHLGSGGFADVFLYRELSLDRMVAIKIISGQLSHEAVTRFTDEANLMARLSTHPSIVTVYQVGIAPDGRPYLVMEYCSQPNLDDRLRQGAFSEVATLQIGVEIAGAVETVHRAGILHRDIKPANVMATDYGRCALTDFGISGAVGSGTPGLSIPWSPPESFRPDPVGDERSDVYSLAATVYALLAGHSPFAHPTLRNSADDLKERILTQPLPPLDRPDVSAGLQRVLARAMAKNPSDRYSSASAFARGLQRVQAELGVPQTRLEVLDDHRTPSYPDRGDTRLYTPRGRGSDPSTVVVPVPSEPTAPRRKISGTALAAIAVAIVLATGLGVAAVRPWRHVTGGSEAIAAGPTTASPPAAATEAPDPSEPASPTTPATNDNDQEALDLPIGPAISTTQLVVPRYKTLKPPGVPWLVDTENPSVSRELDSVQHGSTFAIGISPDRRTITYVDNGSSVRAMPAAGGTGRLLFTSPAGCGRINHKSWSPTDLSVFVLECQVGRGPRRLVVVDVDGNIVRELNAGGFQPSDPTVSPDGTMVAFCGTLSDSSEEGGSIYTTRLDGTGQPKPVTDSAAEADSDPAWSPDGTSLAFRRRVGPPRGEKFNGDNRLEDTDILTVAATGGTVHTLVSGSATDDKPTWSPNGLTIAFVSNRDAGGSRTETKDIWLVPAKGGDPTPLGLEAPRYSTPTWSTR